MKKLLKFFLSWKFLLCFGISWMLCHGWAFVFAFVGPIFHLHWMTIAGSTWLGILLMPNGVGVLVPMPLAVFLQQKLFPKDEKLRQDLKEILDDVKEKLKARKEKQRLKREERLKKKEVDNDGKTI